jgi:hypothetical protein
LGVLPRFSDPSFLAVVYLFSDAGSPFFDFTSSTSQEGPLVAEIASSDPKPPRLWRVEERRRLNILQKELAQLSLLSLLIP